MLDLEPIKKREQTATPGPWFTLFGNDISAEDEHAAFRVAWIDKPNAPPDTEFIAHAREDIPALIAEVERLRELNNRAMAIIADAIMHGMPITEEVAAVRNAIVCKNDQG